MKRKIKTIIAVSLVVFILAGIAVVPLMSHTQKLVEILDDSKVLNAGSTNNNIHSKEYTLALENEYLQFWMNNDTTEFKVVNKANGSEWYSSVSGRADGSPDAAPVSLSYLNSQGSLADMNVMTDSVADGKYSIKMDVDRVTVRYSVGDFSELSLVPYALTEERFQEILDSLNDEFEQMKLTDLYYLTDINIIEDSEQKKDRLAEYPLLAKQKLYIIRDSTREDALTKKDIAKIFAEAGYTEDDYKADSKYFNADEAEKSAPGFNLKVEYTLDGRKLHVCIPHDDIEMYQEFPMTSLTFAPYFGSPKQETNGWYLLPDGSGSVMNFYNGNTDGKIYRTYIYGEELTTAGRENINSDPGASLPVFGIQCGGYGVLCEITKGAAISEIVAYPGDSNEASYAHAVFNVRSTYKTTAATGRKESYIIIQKGRYSDDIELDYHFIDSKNVGLSDMASVMRESIFGDAKGKVSDTLPVQLTLVGLITRRNQFLGCAYNEKVCLTGFKQSLNVTNAFNLQVLPYTMPEQTIKYTQWFYADCIADYYGVPVYSERHWELIEAFIETAFDCGINVILTPVITPPLDTANGIYRTNVQLVGIKANGEKYSFNFEKLDRWIDICTKHGIKYFEISQLFSQWGLKFTPGIVAEVNGREEYIFGWHMLANDPKYAEFLKQFIPALVEELKRKEVYENTLFHVSDEPQEYCIEAYEYAYNLLKPLIGSAKLMDALSEYQFYEKGLVDIPVTDTANMDSFIGKDVSEQWVYYAEDKAGVSIRHMAAPPYRNRAIGIQLYKYDIKGFLHWGYNFYNTELSFHKINPYLTTSAGKSMASGGGFSVYPGANGALLSSRALVFFEALQDFAVCKLLEKYVGRDEVIRIMEEEAGMEITFINYPKNADFLLRLRHRIAEEIKKVLRKHKKLL